MTWRKFTTLIAGLPGMSAWARFCQAVDKRPISDPDEANLALAQLYPGLGG